MPLTKMVLSSGAIRLGVVLTWSSAGTGEMKKRYGFIYVDRDNEGKEAWSAHVRNPSIGTKKSLRPMELLLNKSLL